MTGIGRSSVCLAGGAFATQALLHFPKHFLHICKIATTLSFPWTVAVFPVVSNCLTVDGADCVLALRALLTVSSWFCRLRKKGIVPWPDNSSEEQTGAMQYRTEAEICCLRLASYYQLLVASSDARLSCWLLSLSLRLLPVLKMLLAR